MARPAGQRLNRRVVCSRKLKKTKSAVSLFVFLATLQEIASLKRQFAELLSDIGFIKDGLRARVIERMSSKGSDGVLEATGHEVTHI